MDNFLQLVPMEADADDSDSALVYGEEDDLGVHESHTHEALEAPSATADDSAVQFFAPLSQIASPGAGAGPAVRSHGTDADIATPERERLHYLGKLEAMQSAMHSARASLDARLSALERIRGMEDPNEQLSEYLPLLVEQQRAYESQDREDSADACCADIAVELIDCSHRMSDARDAEVALLATFVFLSDLPHRSQYRSSGSIAPAVATLLNDSGALLDHGNPF